jgi:hypothetical protein
VHTKWDKKTASIKKNYRSIILCAVQMLGSELHGKKIKEKRRHAGRRKCGVRTETRFPSGGRKHG